MVTRQFLEELRSFASTPPSETHPLIVAQFIAEWKKPELNERVAAQEHFLDLCRLLGHPTPAEADATGAGFCFEKGAAKCGGGDGFALVRKRGFFGWESEGKRKDLAGTPHRAADLAP